MQDFFESREARPKLSLGRQLFLVLAGGIVGCLLTVSLLPVLIPQLVPPGEQLFMPLPEVRDQQNASELLEYQRTAVIEAVREVSPAVVGVTRYSRSREFFNPNGTIVPSGVGSGVIINSSGYIVTNYHVIEQAVAVMVTLADGTELEAEVVGSDEGTDLAVLKVEKDEPLPAAVFGDSDQLVVGEFAIAIGNPGGLQLQQTVSLGVISATERNIEVYDWVFGLLQTDAAINPGNSGGPLLNALGQVVGINSVKLLNAEGLGFAIPSNLVRDVVEDLISQGRVVRPMLGVSIVEINPSTARLYELTHDSGLYVADTPAGGPAQRGGILPDDIIVGINDTEITSLRDLRAVLSRKRVGDTVAVRIIRQGQSLTIEVVLADLAG